MKTAFVKTLAELASEDMDVFLLTADLGFKLFDGFRAKFSSRFINAGVAEQNMIGVASGLSMSGKNVYCYSMIPFLVMRAFEAIRVNICYHKLNVKLIGVGAGLTYGLEGMTHHAIEDIAIMRALPNMTVVSPGDPVEARAIIKQSAVYPGPLYIRLNGNNDSIVHRHDPDIVIGKGEIVRTGENITILSAGSMLHCASEVGEILQDRGIQSNVISLHTLKPLDGFIVREFASKSSAVFTLEEHSVIGGLGSAVAEVLLDMKYQGTFKRFALPDQYGPAIGRADYLRRTYGLTADCVSKEIMAMMKSIEEGRVCHESTGIA